ncbi:MAG: hypothetical protein ACRC6M_01880, partial [Microcystaceae cyanobacterium]
MINSRKSLVFPVSMWLCSRLIIVVAMLGVAPFLNATNGGIQAQFGWDVFSAWDSDFYQKISTSGYEVLANHQPGANVAFFPLFPIAIYLVHQLGIPTAIAGTVINNLALLGTLILFYDWVASHNGESVARWVTAVLAWCPLS